VFATDRYELDAAKVRREFRAAITAAHMDSGLGDIEREIDAEARTSFPGGAVRQVLLLQYGDHPEIEPPRVEPT
jgi:hypothetical protein